MDQNKLFIIYLLLYIYYIFIIIYLLLYIYYLFIINKLKIQEFGKK